MRVHLKKNFMGKICETSSMHHHQKKRGGYIWGASLTSSVL